MAVDGVSLTVAALDDAGFRDHADPAHARPRRRWARLRPGRRVNLEMDVIGKYVQRFLTPGRIERVSDGTERDFVEIEEAIEEIRAGASSSWWTTRTARTRATS